MRVFEYSIFRDRKIIRIEGISNGCDGKEKLIGSVQSPVEENERLSKYELPIGFYKVCKEDSFPDYFISIHEQLCEIYGTRLGMELIERDDVLTTLRIAIIDE